MSIFEGSKNPIAICKGIFAYTNSDERIHAALRDLDIDHFFDYVMTSAESGLEKPRLEGYIRLMQVAEIEDPKESGLRVSTSIFAKTCPPSRRGNLKTTDNSSILFSPSCSLTQGL